MFSIFCATSLLVSLFREVGLYHGNDYLVNDYCKLTFIDNILYYGS